VDFIRRRFALCIRRQNVRVGAVFDKTSL
jgi:hypothetical protein